MPTIRSIGILTSGGDAPAMNSAIRAVVREALALKIKPYLIENGYFGLFHEQIKPVTSTIIHQLDQAIKQGGTIIGSARFVEFVDENVRKQAAEILRKHQVDALVVIGGDGSYKGALGLTNLGINCIGLPGTIDNDINSSDFTIGFDTAINTAMDAIDNIRDTMESHHRVGIIEVMGRECGDIALYAGTAGGADIISVSEMRLSEAEIVKRVKAFKAAKKSSVIIVVTEHLYDVQTLAKQVETETGYIAKATVLGHIQRGGRPRALDRYWSTMMGIKAVEELAAGHGGLCIGLKNNEVIATPITPALALPRPKREATIKKVLALTEA